MSESQFEDVLRIVAQLSMVLVAIVVVTVAIMSARVVLMPLFLAIIVGLMFGPVADRLERYGMPQALSAATITIGFVLLLLVSLVLFAVPLGEWVGRAPTIWAKFQEEMANWRGPLEAVASFQEQLKSAFGGASNTVEVTVAEGNSVLQTAMIAPAILAEVLVFLVSLYFYLATRDSIRISVLSLCVTRRMRWRTAHVFREVETKVSSFLMGVTFLNVCVGVLVTLSTWALGLPSPLLWGMIAAVLNYIPYIGHALTFLILLAVGFATQEGTVMVFAPALIYAVINFVEGQIVFPILVGRMVTLNPFLIFLSIAFWIWAWGPFGAIVGVPALLIIQSVISNVLPSRPVMPSRPVRRTARMTERDVVLENAARAIKEQHELEEKAEEEARLADEAAKLAAEEAKREAMAPEPEPEPEPEPKKPATRRRRAPRTPKPAAAT